MRCKNHPDVQALDGCARCAEPYCYACLLVIGGKRYCSQCEPTARKEQPVGQAASRPCRLADEALNYSIAGIFFFGTVLGAIAIYKALEAKKIIARNPHLTGAGKANAAIVIGSFGIVLWPLAYILKIIYSSSQMAK
jgi:hypothetical protein